MGRGAGEAQKLADEIAGELKSPNDFAKVAKAHGLTSESGFFKQDEPIAGIGLAPNGGQQAFTMKEGDVSEPIRTPQGFAFITVSASRTRIVPKLDEVKAKVKDDVIKERAVDVARQKAAAIDGALKSGDFERPRRTPASR